MTVQPSSCIIKFAKGVNDSEIQSIIQKIHSKLSSQPNIQEDIQIRLLSTYLQKKLIFDDAIIGENRCIIINQFFNELKQIPSQNLAQLTRNDIETRINLIYLRFSNQTKNLFSIIIPSTILFKSISNSNFIIKNLTINIIESNTLDNNFDFNNEFNEIISRSEIYPYFSSENYAFFHIDVMAINKNEAALYAFQSYELFRSLINYTYRFQTIYRQLGKLDSLSLISKPPFLFIFDENKKILSYDLDHYPIFNGKKQENIDFNNSMSRKINKLNQNIQAINTNQTDLAELICDVIILLNNALDNYYDQKFCGLNLWLIFEIIAIKGKAFHTVIPKRIASFFPTNNKIEEIIDYFRVLRNNYVHEGKTNQFSDYNNEVFRAIAEDLIEILLKDLPNLQTKNALKQKYSQLSI